LNAVGASVRAEVEAERAAADAGFFKRIFKRKR
jgi:hypothetical protein